jgi:hypothetical protein
MLIAIGGFAVSGSMMACRREPSRMRPSIAGLDLSNRAAVLYTTRLTKFCNSRSLRKRVLILTLP